jgi:hypothetical protein
LPLIVQSLTVVRTLDATPPPDPPEPAATEPPS